MYARMLWTKHGVSLSVNLVEEVKKYVQERGNVNFHGYKINLLLEI